MVRLGIFVFIVLIVISAAQCATACLVTAQDRPQLPPCHHHQQKSIKACSQPMLADGVAQIAPLPALAVAGAVEPPPSITIFEPAVFEQPIGISPPATLTILRV